MRGIRRHDDYKFDHCVDDPGNFIHQYTTYAGARTGTAWDYHEAMALMLLSVATHGLKWRLPFIAHGLRTNLYMMIHGKTSVSRKSTAVSYAKEILDAALPGSRLPQNFTPGALEEVLAEKDGRGTIVFADEWELMLEKMFKQTFMAGMSGTLLELYDSPEWEYRKKALKKGAEPETVDITDSHLCIAGNTTPAIVDRIHIRDIESGFVPRFAVIWPQDFPPRLGMMGSTDNEEQRKFLIGRLKRVRDAALGMAQVEGTSAGKYLAVQSSDETIEVLDAFDEKIDRKLMGASGSQGSSVARIPQMAMKIAMLITCGKPNVEVYDHIEITVEDARQAIKVAEKWMRWSDDFVSAMGRDYWQHEMDVVNSMLLEHDGRVSRTQVARRLRISKVKVDELQLTMIDRGDIRCREERIDKSVRPSLYWLTPEFLEKEKAEKEAENE